jgi:hypothetical protein
MKRTFDFWRTQSNAFPAFFKRILDQIPRTR